MPATRGGRSTDPEAFAELFEQYKRMVYRTAYLMLGSAEEAEDALQEVFVLVLRSLSTYDPGKGAVSTWLHRITINYCLGCRRKRHISCQPLDEDRPPPANASVDAGAASPEREAMRQAIDQLSDKLRTVVILRYYWDLPYAEIAQILDIPLGTVKSRLDLALRTLRDGLASQEEGAQPGYRRSRRLAHGL